MAGKCSVVQRVFIPHLIGADVMVSERLTDARGTVSYRAVLICAPDGQSFAQSLVTDLTEGDLRECHLLVGQMQHYRQAMRRADPCDFSALHAVGAFGTTHAGLRLLKLWAEYATAVLVFGRIADAYLAKAPQKRVSVALSLDLYRQALNFHDLDRAQRFLDEDGPVLDQRHLSAHYRESIYDVFFHLARRMGQKRAAYGYLQQAWAARPNRERAQILLADAGFFQQSQDVVAYADYLAGQTALSPQQIGTLAVAHARLGDMTKAAACLEDLRQSDAATASSIAAKIAAYLAKHSHG